MRLERYLTEALNNTLTTRLQEGLHCVGFNIYQLTGKLNQSNFYNEKIFNDAYDGVFVDSSRDELYEFMISHPKWVESIIRLVNAVEKSEWLKGRNYSFSRTNGIMKDIYLEFNRLAKQDNIKLNNDKWNPADIWASKIHGLPKSFSNLSEYNKFISDMLKSGKLVGISLKQTTKSPKVVFQGPSVKPQVIELGLIKKPKKVFPTGVMIISSDGDIRFQARSFKIKSCSEISVEIMLKSSTARSGKVPQQLYKKFVNQYNIPQMSNERIKQYMDEGEHKLKEIISTLWRQSGINFSENIINKAWENDQPENYMDDVCFWKSIIHSLELAAFLEENKSVADDILMSFYIHGKSMSELSSDFILAY